MDKKNHDILIGINPIIEALRSNKPIDKILLSRESSNPCVCEIINKAKVKKIPIKDTTKKRLDYLTSNSVHQGVVAFVAAHEYSALEDIFKLAKSKNEPPFVIIADKIKDPHNLGAIIRSAECAGAHGVIIPKDNSACLNYTSFKAAAGALEYIPVVKVINLARTIDELKQKGLWVYATAANGESIYNEDLTEPLAIILGNEGKGVSKLLLKKCDKILSLPIKGNISSLNVSVAAGVFMYEVLRKRNLK